MTADITLRGPGDVVAILPYQLGYHPHDSAVVISLRGKRVGLVARTDLPPEEFVGEVVSSLLGPLVRDGATSVIVVGYEDEPDASQPAARSPSSSSSSGPASTSSTSPWSATGVGTRRSAPSRAARRRASRCRTRPTCPGWPSTSPWAARRCGRAAPWRSLVAPEPWRCFGVEQAVDSRSRMPRGRRRSVAAWKRGARPGGGGAAAARPPRRGRPGPRPGRHHLARRADRVAGAERAADRLDRPEGDGDAAVGPADLGRHGRSDRGPCAAGRCAGADLDAWPASATTCCTGCSPCAGRCPTSAPTRRPPCCTVAAHVAWVGGDGAIARAAVDRAVRLAPTTGWPGCSSASSRPGCACHPSGRGPAPSPGQAG